MKLYLVHCGFYDHELADGIYESHTNFFVAAESFEDAKIRVRLEPEFKKRKMHVDGIQEVEAAQGYRIELHPEAALQGGSIIRSSRHRDLAPKATSLAN